MKEAWFSKELAKKYLDITDARTLTARRASADEIIAYQQAQAALPPNNNGDLYLAYLAG